jgi:uncharacterized membrane protein YkoI
MDRHDMRRSLALALLLAAGSAGAYAGHHDWADEDHSYDRARRARERGEILALDEIYARAVAAVPGRVLEAELEHEHGHWIYELKVLDAQGRLRELDLDARTGRLLDHPEDD